MDLLQARDFTKNDRIKLLFLVVFIVFCQIYLIGAAPTYVAFILVLFPLLLILFFVYLNYINDIAVVLLLVFFLPLIYLYNEFHYSFTLELINTIPLVLFVILASLYFIFKDNELTLSISYLQLPILLFVAYYIILSFISISKGENLIWIIYQMFQVVLYLMIFPIMYLIDTRKKYKTILIFLFIIALIISAEYIIFNQVIFSWRIVTFQSGFLPLVVSIIFSFVLFEKNIINKLLAIISLVLITVGTVVTVTRTLWVTLFLVFIIVIFFYLLSQHKLTIIKLSILISILVAPILVIGDTSKDINPEEEQTQFVKYRTESISNPLEDTSVLQRFEFAVYSIQRFLESPIFGKGPGDYLKYKLFSSLKAPHYYMDSTWLYVLWKGGIVGLVLFLWVYIRFFKVTYSNLVNSSNKWIKILNLGLLSGFIGLAFLGLLSPLLIKYKTNVLIAFLFAYIEFERKSLANENNSSVSIE